MRIVNLMVALLFVAATAFSVQLNDGSVGLSVFSGNDMTEDLDLRECNILYAPADDDAITFRNNLAALSGGAVDYYDARNGTPTLATLLAYDAVICYPNYAFFDMVAMGDVLADYVDEGGTVILCVWCTYTMGNYLDGRIMDAGYCPVYSPSGSNHYAYSDYAGDGTSCIYDGVGSFEHYYRDMLAAQGGGVLDGSYMDGEVAAAYQGTVFYANGYPVDANADWTMMIYNMACICGETTAAGDGSWSLVKSLY